jgi:putative SOS response-associated peptidase YedK
MCGRYVSVAERGRLLEAYRATAVEPLPGPSYNVAPTQDVTIVIDHADKDTGRTERELRSARWGLVPSSSRDPPAGARMINARVETLAERRAFARSYAKRRCVLPAAGYIEWTPAEFVDEQTGTTKQVKQPYYIHPAGPDPDADVLSLAGLYEWWRDDSKADDDPDRWLCSCTIITTQARDGVAEIHDRTPLILPPERVEPWLDPTITDTATVGRLLHDLHLPALEIRPVSRAINNVRNNRPDLIEPLPAEADRPLQLTLA